MSIACGGIFQTSRWAILLQRLSGAEPLYVTVEDDGRTIARCLVLKAGKISDLVRRSPGISFLLPVINRGLATLSWLHGPLLHGEMRLETVLQLFDAIEELAARERVMAISFTAHPTVEIRGLTQCLVDRGYRASKMATYLVDLTGEFERNLHRSVGKNARSCLRRGVEIVIVSDEEFPAYYQLVNGFRLDAGLLGFPLEDFLLHQEVLREQRVLFGAKYEGKFIAGLGVLACNGLLIECEAATSQVCFEQRLFVNDLIKLEIMRWGRRNDYQLFDLAGVAVEPEDDKAAGIRRFKEKFGGDYVEYDSFEKDLTRVRGAVLAWARRLHRYSRA